METSLRNRAVQTYLLSQMGIKVDRVGLCYIKNLNKCCVTGNKRLNSSRHDLKFPTYKEWSSVMLNEIDSEHTSTNGMISVLSLVQFVDNFDVWQAGRQLRTREHIGTTLEKR
jgi:hypothetical protein